MLPRGPCVDLTLSKRSRFWQSQLGSIGKIMHVNLIDVEKPEDFAVSSFLESVIGGARMKVSLVCLSLMAFLSVHLRLW